MHSIDFLLIVPECFQIALINVFLLFAICFSYYKRSPWPPVVPAGRRFGVASGGVPPAPSHAAASPSRQREGNTAVFQSNVAAPLAIAEPVAQLVVLALLCSAALYARSPLVYAVGLTDSILCDGLGRLMSTLLCVCASASLAISVPAICRFGRYEFLFIMWLSVLGMLCLIKSYNFLTLYLSIELQSLGFYMLAAMRSKTEASAEAGLKYFILSAFGSAILLLGIALVYGAVGSHNFADLSILVSYFHSLPHTPIAVHVGLGCVCISMLFKLAAAPFHAWVADVYEGSPTPVTAFFAITSKVGAATALIRIVELQAAAIPLLPLVAAVSLLVGSLSAMRQVKLKRLLAFSGVANVGWFLLALVGGQWHLLVIHLLVYVLLSTCLFSILVLPLFRAHPNLEYRQRAARQRGGPRAAIDYGTDSLAIKYISDLSQLHKTNPALSLALAVAFFSLAGVPPLAGFYSKYLIINALTQTEQYLLLLAGLASAVLSAFYYIRVIKTVYFPSAELRFSAPGGAAPPTRPGAPPRRPGHLRGGPFGPPAALPGYAPAESAGAPETPAEGGKPPRRAPCKRPRSLTKRGQDRYSMFTMLAISSNAYVCAFATLLTASFFMRPDYFCIWVILCQ